MSPPLEADADLVAGAFSHLHACCWDLPPNAPSANKAEFVNACYAAFQSQLCEHVQSIESAALLKKRRGRDDNLTGNDERRAVALLAISSQRPSRRAPLRAAALSRRMLGPSHAAIFSCSPTTIAPPN
ncbi:MAG: hypothetical protein RJA70_2726 [Pseudomonadota bacterium]